MLRIVVANVIAIALNLGTALADNFANAIVRPVAQLPLLDSPPGGFFKGPGTAIGTADPGQTYVVLQQVSVGTVVGSEDWLQVRATGNASAVGWIYLGPSNGSAANVTRQ